MNIPGTRQDFLTRAEKFLPGLLAAFALLLIAETCYLMFIQLPRMQHEVQNLVQNIVSSMAEHQPTSAEMSVSYHGSVPGTLMSLTFFACAICWLLLIYQLADKARLIGGDRMQTSPVQCVLYFLIPIGNMWLPLKALQNINAILSPHHRLTGAILIWASWAISIPITLLTVLYTLVQPFATFVDTFGGWNEQQGPLTDAAIGQGLNNLFNSILGPFILYNGAVFILSLLCSVSMALYLDFRSRRMPGPPKLPEAAA